MVSRDDQVSAKKVYIGLPVSSFQRTDDKELGESLAKIKEEVEDIKRLMSIPSESINAKIETISPGYHFSTNLLAREISTTLPFYLET